MLLGSGGDFLFFGKIGSSVGGRSLVDVVFSLCWQVYRVHDLLCLLMLLGDLILHVFSFGLKKEGPLH